MTPSPYTEDTLVQQTTVDYLEHQLGWESVYAHNHEDFGAQSLLGRTSEREVVLARPLRESLAALNPGLPEGAYDDAVRQVTATTASQTIVGANRAQYDLIRDGVQVTYRDGKGRPTHRRLRVLDFDQPENNHFLCVREMWVRGDLYRRRPDVIGFVNGLPLLFIECKNIHRDLQAAFEKNYADYRDTVPHLFHHNAVVMFGNGEKARIGSITSRWGHFHEWKRLAEDEPGAVDMETLLKGVCDKRNFLDLVENFILFDDSSGETRKILARNHQFLGVNRTVDAVRERKARAGKLGVFWHTQGAGKSYSMVLFTRKVHRKLGGNFTFLVLTDRDDLDTQIYKTFAGCGVVDHDRDPCRAASGDHLGRLLAEHKSHVFSLIQKFNQDVDPETGYTRRDDVIVISDEAHRTQYGTLALNMRNALPNAGYIGFTGTPLFTGDEITRQVFGDYVSTYDFQRAVEDGATVPLYYDARGDDLGVAIDDLNERIADKLEELETDDIDVAQRLERELKRDYHVITAEKRLDQVARDFVRHYSAAWETGKAMLVCIDKVTCVRMHALIEHYWDERIEELEAEHAKAPGEQEAIYLRRRIDWMRETRAAVVVSEEQGEVEKFRRWELDIVPHRRIIKEGMDLPAEMRAKPRFWNLQRMAVDDAFKEQEHPFRIAVVCAMWLTGFDVPEAEGELRRRGEPVAEGREPVAHPELEAPVGQVVAAIAVLVGRQPGQGLAPEQRVHTARGRGARGLGERQRRPPSRALPGVPGERAREAAVAEALRLVGQEPAPRELRREPARRVRPGEPAAEVQPEPGLGVAAVMAQPDLQAGHQFTPAGLEAAPGSLQPETQTVHVGLRRRQTLRLLRGGAHRHGVGGDGELEPAVRPAPRSRPPGRRAHPWRGPCPSGWQL